MVGSLLVSSGSNSTHEDVCGATAYSRCTYHAKWCHSSLSGLTSYQKALHSRSSRRAQWHHRSLPDPGAHACRTRTWTLSVAGSLLVSSGSNSTHEDVCGATANSRCTYHAKWCHCSLPELTSCQMALPLPEHLPCSMTPPFAPGFWSTRLPHKDMSTNYHAGRIQHTRMCVAPLVPSCQMAGSSVRCGHVMLLHN